MVCEKVALKPARKYLQQRTLRWHMLQCSIYPLMKFPKRFVFPMASQSTVIKAEQCLSYFLRALDIRMVPRHCSHTINKSGCKTFATKLNIII
jgi:hypothetical protein